MAVPTDNTPQILRQVLVFIFLVSPRMTISNYAVSRTWNHEDSCEEFRRICKVLCRWLASCLDDRPGAASALPCNTSALPLLCHPDIEGMPWNIQSQMACFLSLLYVNINLDRARVCYNASLERDCIAGDWAHFFQLCLFFKLGRSRACSHYARFHPHTSGASSSRGSSITSHAAIVRNYDSKPGPYCSARRELQCRLYGLTDLATGQHFHISLARSWPRLTTIPIAGNLSVISSP